MKYQRIKKYKYKLAENESIQTRINNMSFEHALFELHKSGELVIFKNYLWDGVSGPAIDTKSTMFGGLIHDALYQAIRLELLPDHFKNHIDVLFYNILKEQGMWSFRAWYYLKMVTMFGRNSCIPGDVHIPPVLEVA